MKASELKAKSIEELNAELKITVKKIDNLRSEIDKIVAEIEEL